MSQDYVPVAKKSKGDSEFQFVESINEDTLQGDDGGFVDYQRSSFSSSCETIPDANNTPSTESGIESGDRWDFVYEELQVQQGNRNDEIDSTLSDLSDVSDLSNLSGIGWKPTVAPLQWVQKQINMRISPRIILKDMIPEGSEIPDEISDCTLWKLIINYMCEIPRREPLSNVQKLDDVINLLKNSNKIMVLTGAGVSVSCGIPDFRSRDGVYARLSVDFPDLPDPQAMFDIHYFGKDPRPFFKFAKEIYPGQFRPSIAHKFIRMLERKNKLLRNFTQNIDTLEQAAGIQRVIQCHGSFAKASCMRCKVKFDADFIKEDIFNQRIPYCPHCPSNMRITFDDSSMSTQEEVSDFLPLPIIKPDIVFFGEGLPKEFHSAMAADKDECDLLIVIGSSLKVRPVALIPSSLPPNVPQILINRESLKHLTFDVELLGDGDVIIRELCNRLGKDWEESADWVPMQEITTLPQGTSESTSMGSTDVKADVGLEQTVGSCTDDSNHCQALGRKISLAKRLPDGCFLHVQPNKYVFPGAEIMSDSSDLDDDEDDEDAPGSEHIGFTDNQMDSFSSSNSTEDSMNPCSDLSNSMTETTSQTD